MSVKKEAMELEKFCCKNCGGEFRQLRRKGRPLIFCSEKCRDKWNKGYYKRQQSKIKQKQERLNNIYVVPVFHEKTDMQRLVRTIIQMAMVKEEKD